LGHIPKASTKHVRFRTRACCLCISRRVAVRLGVIVDAKARPAEALADPSYQKHSRLLSDPSGCRGRRISSLYALVCDTSLVHVCRNSSRTARWSGDGEDAHDVEIVDQRAADLLESDGTKRPAHLLLWNRTAVAEPCLIRTQRKLPAGGGYQRSQRPARQLTGGSQARHPSPIRRSKPDCRVRGRRPPRDDM
jgi:hypothetical protein